MWRGERACPQTPCGTSQGKSVKRGLRLWGGSGESLPPFRPPLSDRSPPGATGCATPAACAAALLKEPQRLLLALASACSPADRPVCPRRSTLPGLATRRPTSTSARIVAYHKDQSSRGRAGAKPVGAGCVRGPIVAAEHPPRCSCPRAEKAPMPCAMSCGRAGAHCSALFMASGHAAMVES